MSDRANSYRKPLRHAVLAIFALAFANACSSSKNESLEGGQPANDGTVQAGMSVGMPEGIASSRDIDTNNLVVEIAVAGEDPLSFEEGTPRSLTFNVERNDSFEATVVWYEFINGEKVKLASYTVRQDNVTDSVVLNVRKTQYKVADKDDSSFDVDGDGSANLEERRLGTDPTDPSSSPRPETVINVRVNPLGPEVAAPPVIDGLYDEPVYTGSPATFNDNQGNRLNIGNLMVTQGAGARRIENKGKFRWFAVHDNTYLYIFVLAERIADTSPNRDSPDDAWRDDSIDIYIDGNNSKGDEYDKVDDRHIMIPLLTKVEDQTENTTYFEAGPNSVPGPMPAFEFATCVCGSNNNTWEVKLPLENFGIVFDQPFGIDVHVNEDYDGGDRDAKWGWFHPARDAVDVDNTYFDPSFMATGLLR